MEGVFKLKFNFSDEDLEDYFISFSEDDQDEIEELEADTFFDFHTKEDHYNCIMITTKKDIDAYYDILQRNSVYCEITELSEDILNNRIDIEKEYRNYINSHNFMDWEFFIQGIRKWTLKELDIDFVLDRISSVGMENLTKVEKHFLKTYNE